MAKRTSQMMKAIGLKTGRVAWIVQLVPTRSNRPSDHRTLSGWDERYKAKGKVWEIQSVVRNWTRHCWKGSTWKQGEGTQTDTLYSQDPVGPWLAAVRKRDLNSANNLSLEVDSFPESLKRNTDLQTPQFFPEEILNTRSPWAPLFSHFQSTELWDS